MKACPYCAEEIQDAAIVCRWCGRDINAPEPAATASAAATGALERAVTDHVAQGWSVVSKGDRSAVVMHTKRANHALHLVLSLLTLGLWLIIWLFAILWQSERRRTLWLKDDGVLVYRDGTSREVAYAPVIERAPATGGVRLDTSPALLSTNGWMKLLGIVGAMWLVAAVAVSIYRGKAPRAVRSPTAMSATVPRGCVEHIALKSIEYWEKLDRGGTYRTTHINLWEKPDREGKGLPVGKMHVGSNAIILRRDTDGTYLVQSPLDQSIGWVSTFQVERTHWLDDRTFKPCKPR